MLFDRTGGGSLTEFSYNKAETQLVIDCKSQIMAEERRNGPVGSNHDDWQDTKVCLFPNVLLDECVQIPCAFKGESNAVRHNFAMSHSAVESAEDARPSNQTTTVMFGQNDSATNDTILHGFDTFINKYGYWEYFISEKLLIASMISISVTVFIYAITPELRSNFGYCQINYFCTYLASNVFLFNSVSAASVKSLCTVSAIILHYALLSSFSWMMLTSCFVFESFRSLNQISSQALPNSNSQSRNKAKYVIAHIFGHFIPAIFVFACVSGENIDYGNKRRFCWINGNKSLLVAFIIPTGSMFFTNLLVCLGSGVYFLKFYAENRMVAVFSLGSGWIIFVLVKMLIGSGAQWLLGVLVYFYPREKIIRYIFIVSVSIHGILILVTTLLLKVVRRKFASVAKSSIDKLFTTSSGSNTDG